MNIKRIIKIIGVIILGIVLLIVIFVTYLFLSERADRIQQDKVGITVGYNLEKCTKDYPLYIEISNKSDKTVSFVDFDLDIHRKGYSKDISDWMDYETDKIIEPNHSWGTCWRYKLSSEYKNYDNPDNLEFEIGYKSVRFQK